MAPSSAETWRSRISSSGADSGIPKSLPFWSGFADRPPPAARRTLFRRSSPTPVGPFLQVGGLVAHGGGGTVARQDQGVGLEFGEDPAIDRLDDGGEVAALERRVARAAGEERVAGEEEVGALHGEADGTRGVARRGQGRDAQIAH